jgi:hypothetical protein
MKDENFFFMKDPTKEENKQPIMKPYFFFEENYETILWIRECCPTL